MRLLRPGGLLEAGARPVSGAGIALFRIAFGILMVVNVGLYLPVLVSEYYVDTTFNFAYDPWGFVRPVPGAFGMHLVYVVMGVAGALVAVGLWYRASIAVFFVATTYVFLVDSTYFQNHEYLLSLLSFALIFLPVQRMWSLDARRNPSLASQTQPAWILWFLRFQIGVPYFFGGIAKLNADWFAAEPLRAWLAARTHVEVIGRYFTDEPVVWFANYGSLMLDLTVVGFLLHRRTRLPAFVVVVVFHVLNARLFGLFVFPWLMIAATTLFFDPDWPLRIRERWRERRGGSVAADTFASAELGPRTGRRPALGPVAPTLVRVASSPPGSVRAREDSGASEPFDGTRSTGGAPRRVTPLVATAVAVWLLVQVVLPVRHLAIPGDPNWTEQGHRFAWHMMLRAKSGNVVFDVDDGRRTMTVDPADHLGDKQTRLLAGHPERLARFAHHLSDLHGGAEVRARTSVSLNGRAAVPIVDPTVDLASVQVPWWGHAEWILPNDEPLRPDDAE